MSENNKPMKSYIYNNDLEGAVERFNSSNARWKNSWFETCYTIFNNCKEWAKIYIVDTVCKTIHKIANIKNLFPKMRKSNILYSDDCIVETDETDTQKCYLIEFYDNNNNLICSKVGTTTRPIKKRVNEEPNSKTYVNMGAVYCVIRRVYNCGDIPAEGLESYFRATYIRKFPNSFYKNDRFIDEYFDYAEADKIAKNYLCMA